jgi:hypothetical protein
MAPALTLRIAITALAAAIAPAFAQTYEPREPAPSPPVYQQQGGDPYREGYRKGYDDGFARGYEKAVQEARAAAAAAPPPPPPPRSTGPITISGAVYGTSSKNCDATRYVAHRANGKRTYSFEVNNEMCGDPSRGDRKELNVTYICGTIAKTATAYEHRTVYLDCTP